MVNYYILLKALYTGLITGALIAIPMGPAGIESVRWTISKGLNLGIKVAAGSLIADAIDIVLINYGLLDLIETNKLLEVFFWILSGTVIIYIGYSSIKNSKSAKQEKVDENLERIEDNPSAVFRGFIINFSNPMTHFFWLTLSSTIIRTWRNEGKVIYSVFALFMLSGMFLSLFTINFLTSKGKKFSAPKVSGKAADLLSYGITAIGIAFIVSGLYKLYLIYI